MTDSDASIFATLQAAMDTEQRFKEPEARRAWLLLKALEHLPLPEALKLAEAADSFVSGDASERSGAAGMSSRLDGAKVFAQALPATTAAAASDGGGSAAGNFGIKDHGWRSADTMNLTVLASTDDITRYLGQHGDLITSNGNSFVVNGQSEVTLDELLARADRLRVQQGLPTYALLPAASVVAAAKKKAEPRPPKSLQPPSRKEREHWAQQVTAL
jgi:hypothetical protein